MKIKGRKDSINKLKRRDVMRKLVLVISILLLVFTFNLETCSFGVAMAGEWGCEPPPPPPEPPPDPPPTTPSPTNLSVTNQNEANGTRVEVRYGNFGQVDMIPGKLYDITYTFPFPSFAQPYDPLKDKWFGFYSYIGPVWNRVDFYEIGEQLIKSYDKAKKYFGKTFGEVEMRYTIHLTDQSRGITYGLIGAGTGSSPNGGAGITAGPTYTSVKFRPHAIIQWWAVGIKPAGGRTMVLGAKKKIIVVYHDLTEDGD